MIKTNPQPTLFIASLTSEMCSFINYGPIHDPTHMISIVLLMVPSRQH